MASDNRAHYSRIGFVVIAGAIAIAATLIYLGGFRDKDSELLVETFYDNPVTGLSVGSPVNLFGVKIGEVREISFAMTTYHDCGVTTDDYGRVCIVMALDKKALGCDDVPIAEIGDAALQRARAGLRATVASNGITGLSRVDLKFVGDEPSPPLPAWQPRYLLIPPSPSLMDNFAVAATKVVNKLKTMDFDVVWSNVNRMADAAAQTAENAEAMLTSSRAGVRQVVDDVGESSASFRELSTTLKDNPSLILRPSDPAPLPETAR